MQKQNIFQKVILIIVVWKGFCDNDILLLVIFVNRDEYLVVH